MFGCLPLCDLFDRSKDTQKTLQEITQGSQKLYKPQWVFQTPDQIVITSSCYNKNIQRQWSNEYKVSLRLIGQTYSNLYGIYQWQGGRDVLLGSIEIFNQTQKIWLRWDTLSGDCIREFDKHELSTLIDLFEKAKSCIDSKILINFNDKITREECYQQQRMSFS